MKKHHTGNIEVRDGIKKALILWIWFVSVTTIITLLIYVVAQQDLRMDANNPQIQIAEDDATAVLSGNNPDIIPPAATIDISQSLAPFVIFFDGQGIPTASSGMLSGRVPVVPVGVFDYARTHGEDRFTWQPADNVRVAAVVVRIGTATNVQGFVLAARSLRDVEDREGQLGLISLSAYIALLITETGLLILTALIW